MSSLHGVDLLVFVKMHYHQLELLLVLLDDVNVFEEVRMSATSSLVKAIMKTFQMVVRPWSCRYYTLVLAKKQILHFGLSIPSMLYRDQRLEGNKAVGEIHVFSM